MYKKHSLDIPDEWYELNPDFDTSLENLFTTYKKKRSTVPRGYVLEDRSKNLCRPIPEVLEGLIQCLIDFRMNNTRSLREIRDIIQELETGCEDIPNPQLISVGGITQLFDRIERDLGIYTKDLAKDRIRQKQKERIKKARDEGRSRDYNHSSSVKEKLRIQKNLTATNREIKQIEKERKRLQSKAARDARKLKLKKDPTAYMSLGECEKLYKELQTIIKTKMALESETSGDRNTLSAPVDDHLTNKDYIDIYLEMLSSGKYSEDECMLVFNKIRNTSGDYERRRVAFLPTPRQYAFLSAADDVVLYGGAAGGGKSYAMVIDALRYAHVPHYKGVIIRKTSPELKELIDNSRELYPLLFPGAKFNGSDNVWKFPSGAQIFFSFLDKPGDKYKYQGIQYQYVGFDELSQHEIPEGFWYLLTRLRDPKGILKPILRATANPGSMWVYDLFIKNKEEDKTYYRTVKRGGKTYNKSFRFVPAKLSDNPFLSEDGEYESGLAIAGEDLAKQLLDGDWLSSVDNMFPEFELDTHVIEPFDIPKHWNRFAGLDYGYVDPSAGVWFAVDPQDGSLIIYDEFLQRGLTGREFAAEIKQKEASELVRVGHIIDWSVFARTGHTGPSIAESIMRAGVPLQRADKSREAGWSQVHEYLRKDPNTGAPRIRIFASCNETIRQIMSAKMHKTQPNELNTTRNEDGHWDLLDCLRYGVMSRPRKDTQGEYLRNVKQRNTWETINGYFS